MDRRLELHSKLCELVGNNNVYFQPPASVQISYPCVIYNVSIGDAKHADGIVYSYTNSYDVIFIYRNPNVEILERVLNSLPMCKVSRTYIVDNLNHYAFNLYY